MTGQTASSFDQPFSISAPLSPASHLSFLTALDGQTASSFQLTMVKRRLSMVKWRYPAPTSPLFLPFFHLRPPLFLADLATDRFGAFPQVITLFTMPSTRPPNLHCPNLGACFSHNTPLLYPSRQDLCPPNKFAHTSPPLSPPNSHPSDPQTAPCFASTSALPLWAPG